MRNEPEDSARIVRISQTGSTIAHQYKITPTIFYANLSSTEKDVSDIDTGETKAEDI